MPSLASSKRAHGQQSMRTLRPSMEPSMVAFRWDNLVSVALLWQFHAGVIIQALVHGCATKLPSTSL